MHVLRTARICVCTDRLQQAGSLPNTGHLWHATSFGCCAVHGLVCAVLQDCPKPTSCQLPARCSCAPAAWLPWRQQLRQELRCRWSASTGAVGWWQQLCREQQALAGEHGVCAVCFFVRGLVVGRLERDDQRSREQDKTPVACSGSCHSHVSDISCAGVCACMHAGHPPSMPTSW